jgi:hypothetical protein
MVRLITAFDFSPADFKRFLTALADRLLFGNHCHFRIGVFANGTRLHTAAFYVVFRILASLSPYWLGCIFSQAGWLLYSDSTSDVKYIWRTFLLTAGRLYAIFAPLIFVLVPNAKHKFPNFNRGHTEFWIMHERHGSRTWYLDILLNCHNCMITSFQWNNCLVKINICI